MHTFTLNMFCRWEHRVSESFVSNKTRSKLLNKVNLQRIEEGDHFSKLKDACWNSDSYNYIFMILDALAS